MTELTLGELKALRQREAKRPSPGEVGFQPVAHVIARQTEGHQADTTTHRERLDVMKSREKAPKTDNAAPKKSSGKGPAVLPNNTAFNPYTNIKFGSKGAGARLKARDPRFSDFSGTLNDDLFRKSYAFLGDMLQEEVREIKAAVRAGERSGANSLKATAALGGIAHMNIASISDAKRALDRYKTQQKQLQSDTELRALKKDLIEQEKQKIATTGKTPFYYSEKKIRKIHRAKEAEKERAALQSAAINAGAAGAIHKKVARTLKRKVPKKPKVHAKAAGKKPVAE
ncbi:hypothetical protein, conserved [Babesia bigemina]|uniref:rRNA biogenesis protein RRP36 n=1 Tax=Babesia bigemina TaxID=5866 RepID=A0A061DA54_BABBI|nr:hypothetical protein, conserved [Babesia bigemina]CDR97413.1 hypothetical protein, conserved [Babesia bigemina]|eukprot:XP_012769599.1 hypothetical protein, conserved [Babesia bigemina]